MLVIPVLVKCHQTYMTIKSITWYGSKMLAKCERKCCVTRRGQRTSDGGNGNHSVSLPIILIKIKVNRKLPPSYKSSLLLYIL